VQKGWDRAAGWGNQQGDMHRVAAMLGSESHGSDWVAHLLLCMNRLRKHCSHLAGG